MRLTIINGSPRKEAQSARVARYLAEQAVGFHDIERIDLARNPIPFWDGEDEASKGEAWQSMVPRLGQSDAFILISPKWNGMASPLLKQWLMNADVPLVGHKPTLLVSVSSGIHGVYPIPELQGSNKNNKLLFIPAHLIVRSVGSVLHPQPESAQSERERSLRRRIDESLALLARYSELLLPLRHYRDPYPYGM